MKKSIFLSLAAASVLFLTACNSLDSLITKYEKACENGDAAEATEIMQKMQKFDESELTEEQMQRISEATLKLTSKATENTLNAVQNLF